MPHENVIYYGTRCMVSSTRALLSLYAARVRRSRCCKHPSQSLGSADACQRDAEVVGEQQQLIHVTQNTLEHKAVST
jgi:hypothetical protein